MSSNQINKNILRNKNDDKKKKKKEKKKQELKTFVKTLKKKNIIGETTI